MTVEDLMGLLSALPGHLPVFTAYDSMAVDDDLIVMVVEAGEHRGLYICAPSADVKYEMTLADSPCKGGKILGGY